MLLYATSAHCVPVINACLAHSAGGRNLERTFTTVFAGYAIGGVLSPTVGGALAKLASMRAVYFISAALFFLSASVIAGVSSQRVPHHPDGAGPWASLMNWRFLRFAAVICLMFSAVYRGFPLVPNSLSRS